MENKINRDVRDIDQPQMSFSWEERQSRLEKDFIKSDSENPQVYEKFKEYAFQAINAGRTHMGARVIIERIRWYSQVEAKGDEFKINNNYTPYYVRKFIKEFPEHARLFQLREIRNV